MKALESWIVEVVEGWGAVVENQIVPAFASEMASEVGILSQKDRKTLRGEACHGRC